MTKESSGSPVQRAASVRVFDQTNGILGDPAGSDADRSDHRAWNGDVPVATNMLFGGQ